MREIVNKKAFFNFEILEKKTAGIVLKGTELKSIINNGISFNDSYCYLENQEVFLKNLFIPILENAGKNNHEPLSDRKLLLNKKEIKKFEALIKEKSFSIIPLRFFFNETNLLKLEIGVGRGKKIYDKRQTIKEKDLKRENEVRFK